MTSCTRLRPPFFAAYRAASAARKSASLSSSAVAASEELPAPSNELALDDLLQLAYASNPAIAQAEARVRALRGEWVQVGLAPNPTAGYMATEIGDDGRAGQQGGYFGQQFITGGKLRLNRVVLSQEIERAEQQFAAAQQRVETDVRRAYYAALIAQRRIELGEELLKLRREQFNLRMQAATGQGAKPDQHGKVRKSIARLKTVQRERVKK